MQIRTGLTLAAGIGIGIFVGMGVSEDTKERLANVVKRRLVIALTGEDWQPKNPMKPKEPTDYKVKYSDRINPDDDWKQYLCFKSSADAWDFVHQMYTKCEQNPLRVISVFEVCSEKAKGHRLNWAWDKCGWTLDEIKDGWKVVCIKDDPLNQGYRIDTPKPHEI